MLMTADRPTARNMTPQAQALLDVIRGAGKRGITRAEIAATLDKSALNKWDLALLKMLEREGYITSTQRPGKRPNMLEYVYVSQG